MAANIKSNVKERIEGGCENVLLRRDFRGIGSYAQVGRALKGLIEEGVIARIGKGLYAKTRRSSINPSKSSLAAFGGFKEVSREALDRLGIPWRPSEAEVAYNSGRSTQIPANAYVIVEVPTTRKISFGALVLECKYRPGSSDQ